MRTSTMRKVAGLTVLALLIVACEFPDDPCILQNVGDMTPAAGPGLIIGHSNGGLVGDALVELMAGDWVNASQGRHDSRAWATNGASKTGGLPVLDLAQEAQPDATTIIVILSRRFSRSNAEQRIGEYLADTDQLLDELVARFPSLQKVYLAGRVSAEHVQGSHNGEPGTWWHNRWNMILAANKTSELPIDVVSMDRWGSQEQGCGPLPLGPEHFSPEDGLHPNNDGAAIIADYMVAQLES